MQFSFLLAVLAALVIAENCPAEGADGVAWRLGFTSVAIAVVVGAAQLISLVTSVRVGRGVVPRDRILAASARWRRWHTGLWIAVTVLINWGFGWAQIVRFNWGLDRAFLVDDLLILLPVLLPLVLSWIAFHQIEWTTYRARIAAGYRTGRRPSLRRFLSVHARHYLGVMLAPILVLLCVQDAVGMFLPHFMDSGWSVAVYAVPIALLVVFFPLLLRRLWKTRPLGDGALRHRLTDAAARVGLPVREILVWETGGMVINAAISGWLPGRRYVFLSDGLIDRLTEEEVEGVFGHELGHIRHRHLAQRGLVMLAPLSLLMAAESIWPDTAWIGGLFTDRLSAALQLPLAFAVLAGLSSYAFFVFGGFCRLLETEADLFGCGVLGPGASDDAYRVFISALEKLGLESGVNRRRSTWQHPSIARRTEFLAAAAQDPARAERFRRRVRWLNRGLLVCVVVPAVVAVLVG